MTRIKVNHDEIELDAAAIAPGLDLAPSILPSLIKAGEVTSVFERGEGADAGRCRVTFLHGARGFRITLDTAGAIVATQALVSSASARA